MTYAGESHAIAPADKPLVTSYDLGFEYSQQHYIAVQCMVEDADAEPATLAHVPAVEEIAA